MGLPLVMDALSHGNVFGATKANVNGTKRRYAGCTGICAMAEL